MVAGDGTTGNGVVGECEGVTSGKSTCLDQTAADAVNEITVINCEVTVKAALRHNCPRLDVIEGTTVNSERSI